jgi:tetratricopeptide (TPR) repeat protein
MLPFEAQKSFEKALSIDPANPDYNFALGAVLVNMRNAANSVGLFQKYVAARPNDPQGHLALGRAYFVTNDYDRCRDEMLKISGDSPTAGAAAYFLGKVARQNDKYDEAASLFERAIQLLPAFAGSYAELARVRLEQNRPDDARAVIDRALAIQADNFEVNLALLVLYKRTHDSRVAEQADRVRELDRERNTKRDKLEQLMMRGVEVRPY